MLEPGKLVVHPAQGVGRIEGIETREYDGLDVDFYVVKMVSGLMLFVPIAIAERSGLRGLASPEESLMVLNSLRDHSNFTGYAGQNWNRRYREYSEKLKTGSLADAAYVFKELKLISRDKNLSFGERRLLEQSHTLFTTELSYSLGLPLAEIIQLVDTHFANKD